MWLGYVDRCALHADKLSDDAVGGDARVAATQPHPSLSAWRTGEAVRTPVDSALAIAGRQALPHTPAVVRLLHCGVVVHLQSLLRRRLARGGGQRKRGAERGDGGKRGEAEGFHSKHSLCDKQLRRVEKRGSGKAAAAHIKPRDVIFIDGSTTTEYMAPYLISIPDITVITNNMSLAAYLSENGTVVYCLGGKVYEAPYMLGGNETVICAQMYNADKMFFSTLGFSKDGKIFGNSMFQLLRITMMKNSKEIFYLADHEKSGFDGNIITADFGKVNYIISDYEFPEETKEEYPCTVFEYVTDR